MANVFWFFFSNKNTFRLDGRLEDISIVRPNKWLRRSGEKAGSSSFLKKRTKKLCSWQRAGRLDRGFFPCHRSASF
jgi:hypothetical protein